MPAQLLQGCDAITEAAVAAGMRFFSGYPMLPFTGLLESVAKRMPQVGGVCMNAASEIEAANMTLGAAAAGARAGTGSCGQGIALMQETIAEGALNQVPFVVFNMARGQQDYFQSTRGGGWGDYRTITLAPKDAAEAADHTQLLFHLSDKYRSPVILYGDYLIADTNMSVEVAPLDFGPLPAKDWVLDPSRGGTGRSRVIWTWDIGKMNNPGLKPDAHWRKLAEKFDEIGRTEARHESYLVDDADYVVVSWGTSGPFIDYVVDELRADGVRIGSFRPITLWPFPEEALAAATERCRRVLVYELNAGQMLDDVRLSVTDRRKIDFIGGVSVDYSGMRQGPLLDVSPIRERILESIEQGA
jgi:2-oxoglutarate/2-oxoacid ferredoxin oxidoreductase subunit alpha